MIEMLIYEMDFFKREFSGMDWSKCKILWIDDSKYEYMG